jgi:6,7-dimethyl-8-ribityllumazine synthase
MKEHPVNLHGKGLKIGIVDARFNEVGDHLLSTCLDRLKELGVKDKDITLVQVPGALEIPLILQNLAQTGKFSGLIALGVVIRGETLHFEVISKVSILSVAKVSLKHNIPISNVILTTENESQAQVRVIEKGRAAAEVVVEMVNHLQEIKTN